MSGAIIFIQKDLGLDTVQEEITVGSLNLVAAFGGLVAGKAADALGRRKSIGLACLIFITGAVIMTLSTDFYSLLLGRVITGIGVGCGFVISPIYNSEIAPPDIRGKLVALTDICINLGLVLGYLAAFIIDVSIFGIWKWRLMLGIGIIPPVVICITLLFLPESPRWLVTVHRNDEALAVLHKILPPDEDVHAVLDKIVRTNHDEAGATWGEVLRNKNPVHRRIVYIVVALCFMQMATGSEALVYYIPTVLSDAGIKSRTLLLLGTAVVGLFKLLGEVLAAYLVEVCGRRWLLNFSSITSTISIAFISVIFMFDLNVYINLFGLCSFMWWFSFGIGPITWVVASELLPLHLKGKAMSFGVFLNRATSAICALTFLSLEESLSISGAFAIYTVISVIGVFFYFICIPETRGRSLEEIQEALSSNALK